MKIVVIGGSGFIGTTLVAQLLEAGHDVIVVDKVPSATFPRRSAIADVRDIESLRTALAHLGAQVIFNLAAEHKDNIRPVSLYDQVNVDGASNVCAIAAELGINDIVFTSSVAVYGFAPPNTGESGEIAPFNAYGRTKAAAETIYREWQSRNPSRRSLTIVRPTVVFGPRNRGNVFNLLRQIASGRFLMIGAGRNRKSMAYVENVAAFLVSAVPFGPGVHLYNYVDKPDLSMNELVHFVHSVLGRPEKGVVRLPYRPAYVAAKVLDAVSRVIKRPFTISGIRVKKFVATTQFSSAASETGFAAPVSIHEGLRRTVQYEFLDGERRDDVRFFSE